MDAPTRDVESIPSLKLTSIYDGGKTVISLMEGAVKSGVSSNTELMIPGDPPVEASDADQLERSEQGSFGLILSKE